MQQPPPGSGAHQPEPENSQIKPAVLFHSTVLESLQGKCDDIDYKLQGSMEENTETVAVGGNGDGKSSGSRDLSDRFAAAVEELSSDAACNGTADDPTYATQSNEAAVDGELLTEHSEDTCN